MSPEEALKNSVRGQYVFGEVKGKPMQAYRQSPRRRHQEQDRDLSRAQGLHRQLALGRRALLHPHRQGDDGAQDRGCDPVQEGAPACCSATSTAASSRTPRLVFPHPARRGRADALLGEAAGPQGEALRRQHELPLFRLLQVGAVDRLRNADLRLPDRRRDPVSSVPTTSRAAGPWCSRCSTPGRRATTRCIGTRRAPPARPRPTICWRGTGADGCRFSSTFSGLRDVYVRRPSHTRIPPRRKPAY